MILPRGSRLSRCAALGALLALAVPLSGCGGGSMSNFDPSDMLDFLDTKKKLQGERRPVFPEGVPGLEQGVPKDLYKGAQREPEALAPVAEPPPESPKQKRAVAKRRATPPPSEQSAAPDDVADEAPPPKLKSAKRIKAAATPAAPPPAAAAPPQPSAQSAFPAPMPSGSFSR